MNIKRLDGLSNAEFFERHAAPGRIGLVGGTSPLCRLIRHAQRHVDAEGQASRWSHAFVLQGRRPDGHHWVIESDLEMRRKHIALGVQENRAAKYFDETAYPQVAILDLGLTEGQTSEMLRRSFDMVASRVRYSLRELVGTLLALRHPGLRPHDNLLAVDHSAYCSAFVCHVFQAAGLDLTPLLEVKNSTPEDLFRTPLAKTIWMVERPAAKRPRLLTRIKNKRAARKKKANP